jgi:hypothetical protein
MSIDISALGQAIDTTWGRTSTPKVASYSVKFSLGSSIDPEAKGHVLIAMYAAIVNFGAENEMATMKVRYSAESDDVINKMLSNVKDSYKDICKQTLRAKQLSSEDSFEIKNFAVHNPKRTAYYRKRVVFEVT